MKKNAGKKVFYEINSQLFISSKTNKNENIFSNIIKRIDYFKKLKVDCLIINDLFNEEIQDKIGFYLESDQNNIDKFKLLISKLDENNIELAYEINLRNIESSVLIKKNISKNDTKNRFKFFFSDRNNLEMIRKKWTNNQNYDLFRNLINKLSELKIKNFILKDFEEIYNKKNNSSNDKTIRLISKLSNIVKENSNNNFVFVSFDFDYLEDMKKLQETKTLDYLMIDLTKSVFSKKEINLVKFKKNIMQLKEISIEKLIKLTYSKNEKNFSFDNDILWNEMVKCLFLILFFNDFNLVINSGDELGFRKDKKTKNIDVQMKDKNSSLNFYLYILNFFKENEIFLINVINFSIKIKNNYFIVLMLESENLNKIKVSINFRGKHIKNNKKDIMSKKISTINNRFDFDYFLPYEALLEIT